MGLRTPCSQRGGRNRQPRGRRRYLNVLAPEAGGVVGHGEAEQQEQEKQCGDHDQLGQFFAGMPDVHEEESDQSGFDGGDAEGDGGVEAAEIERRGLHSQTGADEQREPNTAKYIFSGDDFDVQT